MTKLDELKKLFSELESIEQNLMQADTIINKWNSTFYRASFASDEYDSMYESEIYFNNINRKAMQPVFKEMFAKFKQALEIRKQELVKEIKEFIK